MHLRTSRRLRLKGGNRSSLWTLTSPQSHIEKVQCDREQKLCATDGRTDGRTRDRTPHRRGRRATRTKRQNHRRSHRKLERVNRERSQLESAPSPVALEHGFFQVLIRRGSANTARGRNLSRGCVLDQGKTQGSWFGSSFYPPLFCIVECCPGSDSGSANVSSEEPSRFFTQDQPEPLSLLPFYSLILDLKGAEPHSPPTLL